MEYWKSKKKSLQLINIIFLIIMVCFLCIYKSVYNENFFFNVQIVDGILIISILLLLVISFFDRFYVIYPKLLYGLICLVTIGMTEIAFLADLDQYVFGFILLFIVTIFSGFHKKVLEKFTFIYLLFVVPLIFIPAIDIQKKAAFVVSTFVVLALAFMKSKYDISVFKAYSESTEFKELLLFNAKEAFALHEIIFDEDKRPIDSRFVNVNKAFEEMTGLKGKDLIGKKLLEVLPNTEQFWIDFFGEVVTKKERKQTTNYSQEFGKFFEASAYPVENNKFAVLFNDVTEIMEKENKLKYALQRSKKADQLKNQFLNDVNHRLRTPFNGMMGMLQLINVENMDEENRELFDAMTVAMKNCNNVLNQISKYIDIQGMNFEFSKQYIHELVQGEINNYENVDISLTINDNCKDIALIIEKNVLVLTFREVLSNAVKHTNNQKVEVNVHCEANFTEAIKELYIDVVDYGMGIDQDKQEYIFNEFYHHDFINIYREPEKICLSICKQMLQSIGGDILLESEVGVKTKFTILLPVFLLSEKLI